MLSIGTGTITFDGTNVPNLIRSSNSLVISSGGFGSLTLDSATGIVALNTGDLLSFEGATNDAFETTLAVVDPTSDRAITLPDADGEVVLDDATQTLTNKTINGLALVADTDGLSISGGTTPRTLTLTGGNKTLSGAGTIINLAGDLNLSAAFTTTGGDALTFTTTAPTSVTLPTAGTLSTLSGAETLTNKTIKDSTFDGDTYRSRRW